MSDILKEIQEIKTQQLVFNNLMIENAKQNEMISSVLQELLSELQITQEGDGFEELVEAILVKLDNLLMKLDNI
jgi:acid stress-induced BolA-like protein IbaG/YrbA